MLWLERYGYLNFVYIIFCVRNKCLEGATNKVLFVKFSSGKATQRSIYKGEAWRSSGLLDLVHSDLFGLMPTQALYKISFFLFLLKLLLMIFLKGFKYLFE